jgi:hypothetical protein
MVVLTVQLTPSDIFGLHDVFPVDDSKGVVALEPKICIFEDENTIDRSNPTSLNLSPVRNLVAVQLVVCLLF